MRTADGNNYAPQKITAALIRRVASWRSPEKPREIRDASQGLILRHQPSGYLSLYAELGRGKRERLCNARDILDPIKSATLREALNKARILQGKDASGHDFKAERETVRSIPTFRRYFEDTYKPWLIEERRDGAGTAARIESQFLETFGKHKLDEITPDKVMKWRTQRRKDEVTAETINRDLTALKAMLSYAVDPFKKLPANPLAGFKLEKVDRHKRIARAFTEAEEKALRKALEQRDEKMRTERRSANEWRAQRGYELLPDLSGKYADHLTPAVLVALGTGMRRGEQFALQWSKVDFDGDTIRVEGATAKTFETREIPMSPEVRRVLAAWRLQNGNPRKGHVFSAPSGGQLQNLKKSFYAVMTAAGIERESTTGRLSWHSLRHTFATRLIARGVDVATVKELLGHADLATVTARYVHTDKERKRAAVAGLNA